MTYKLIAADMDGTLLNDDEKMTQRTKTAIVRAVEAGCFFVTATGRAISGAEMVNCLFDQDMPFIVFNGASVVMGKSGKVLFNKYLGTALAREVLDMGKRHDAPMIVWTDAGMRKVHTDNPVKEYLRYDRKYNAIGYITIGGIDEIIEEKVNKVIWFSSRDRIRCYQSEMNAYFGGRVNCYSSLPEFLEFVNPQADKGAAMEEIGKIYGIDRSEMIAVGDGYNDIPMLKYAGLGVAMENAPDDVKAASDLVTLSNNDDGLAAVIERYVLRGK